MRLQRKKNREYLNRWQLFHSYVPRLYRQIHVNGSSCAAAISIWSDTVCPYEFMWWFWPPWRENFSLCILLLWVIVDLALFLWLCFPSISSSSPSHSFSSQIFHLILSLISSSPVSDEEMVHVSGSSSQGWKQQQGVHHFLGLQHTEGKEISQNETQIQLPSHTVPVPFEQSCDICPGIQLLCGWPRFPTHTVPRLSAPFQKSEIHENDSNVTENLSVPESSP